MLTPWFRHGLTIFAMFCAAFVNLTPYAKADQSDAINAIEDFDHAMLSIFRRGQDALTATTRPVMIIARDVTVLSDDGGQATYSRDAPHYLVFKSTSHILLGIIGAVTPWPQGDAASELWKNEFSTISEEIEKLLPLIDGLKISESAMVRQKKMLETAKAFVDQALSEQKLTREAVIKVINDMRPEWSANMRDAARAELEALHKAVSDARSEMDEDDWNKMYVVHHGGSNVKNVNVVLLYLQRVMPEKVTAGQVLFAESAHGTDAMAKYAGYAKMQRLVGAWAFGDPARMEVDLLGYEAGSILDELIPVSPSVFAVDE
ncbi:hypothetical protein [Ruegeria arenilitoris]|uniref:hypothetical protein n=1 Tax=Ruegeria arenilitoris TaxID=1173585 RepID=UPI00147C74F5|nr:hypothetical protein [Ruegeria arenilitoris]